MLDTGKLKDFRSFPFLWPTVYLWASWLTGMNWKLHHLFQGLRNSIFVVAESRGMMT